VRPVGPQQLAPPRLAAWGLALLALAGCGQASPADRLPRQVAAADLRPAALGSGERLSVVATTSIVADVVAAVGGPWVDVTALIPPSVDPHAFEPTPRDVQRLSQAHVVFVNGLGLELFLADLIGEAGGSAGVVAVSDGVTSRRLSEEGDSGGFDPHTWLDPRNVAQWTANIETALAALDPAHAEAFAANAASTRAELAALDGEIRRLVETVPPERRRLLTDHEELGYFAEAYGFTIVGSILPGPSSLAEPSAADLAALLDRVRAEQVPAIFVTSVVDPAIVRRLAEDAGIQVVTLYVHSLSDPDGPAPDYPSLMRYNAAAIVDALAP